MTDLVRLDAPLPLDATATPLAADALVEATVVLARRAPLTPDAAAPLSREQLAAGHGADPTALARVVDHAIAAGLAVTDADPAARLVHVRGTVAQMQAAYGADLAESGGERVQTSPVLLPTALAADVLAVLGLDTRDAARHQSRQVMAAAGGTSYTPLELADRYAFPPGDGTGQTVAIIELGGGYETADLEAYAKGLGVPPATVTAVPVDGAANLPGGDPQGADGEVCLDIEVVAALVPAASIRVYFAPNTDAGFVDAVSQAAHDPVGVTVMSISWGSAESTWTVSSTRAFDAALADAAALGITVCVASGDDGSADRQTDGAPHADFPASSPHALGCGGTRLPATGAEVVWNDGTGGTAGGAGGGGVSALFGVPAFQAGRTVAGSALTGRGVPDVAADADPQTGYRIRIDGIDTVIGGTSAAAPLWAALIARLQQAAGANRWQTPLLYGLPDGTLRDITSGSNGAYAATAGWDACTALGTPDGGRLAAALPKP